jgi:hypothetical protein
MSGKYIKAVANYERRRQAVVVLNNERTELLGGCSREDAYQETCLQKCYSEWIYYRNEYGEKATYSEHLNHPEENTCNACKKAYAIKTGPLAEAKKQFGIAKRVLSALGKSALK